MTARVPEPAPPHLRPSRFSHLVLQTARYEEMVAWYKTWLSARPMLETPVVCFLTFDDEHHRLLIGRNPNATPRDPKAAGVMHFAYAVETLEDLVNYYLRLKAHHLKTFQMLATPELREKLRDRLAQPARSVVER